MGLFSSWVTILAFGFVGIGCDGLAGDRQPLMAGPPSVVKEKRPALAVGGAAPDSGLLQDGGLDTLLSSEDLAGSEVSGSAALAGTYQAMCQHYCDTLEKTDLYACLSMNASDCAARFSTVAAECVDLRCSSELVQPSLCLTQCDALATNLSAYCRIAPAGVTACASPLVKQNETCRAGCNVSSP